MITAKPEIMAKYGDSIQWQIDHILPQWILKHLDIEITQMDAKSATFQLLGHNPDLFRRFPPPRDEEHLCGQAIMALADSLLIFPIVADIGHTDNMATLDLSTQFLKPVHPGDIRIEAKIIQRGRRTLRGVVDIYDKDNRHCSTSMVCYMFV